MNKKPLGKHIGTDYTQPVFFRSWRRNVVTLIATGSLVAVTSLPGNALQAHAWQYNTPALYANPSVQTQEATRVLLQASYANNALNSSEPSTPTPEDPTTPTTPDTPDTPSSPDSGNVPSDPSPAPSNPTPKNPQDNTSDTSNNAPAAHTAPQEQAVLFQDPEVAQPNAQFGEPTTNVVIKGSVNGNIIAAIALDEPTGIPEGGDKNKYNFGSGEAWCAYFVMYCARAAKLPTSVIPNYPGCKEMVSYYKNIKRWQDFTTLYKPHTGDLVFYSSEEKGTPEHVGIVTASNNTTISTREGNTQGGQVSSHIYSITAENGAVGNDWYIIGYASPDYPNKINHEHQNDIDYAIPVSETSHLVSFKDCSCGYHRMPEEVSHNFQSTDNKIKLSESDEWECIDCKATQKNYTLGIMETPHSVALHTSIDGTLAEELPAGSKLSITSVELAPDGNYWGYTDAGYAVKMSEAGLKQQLQFAKADTSVPLGAVPKYANNNVLPAEQEMLSSHNYTLGNAASRVMCSGEKGKEDAHARELVELKAGTMYMVQIGSITSRAPEGQDAMFLGQPMLKLIAKQEDGELNTEAFKYYGTSSYCLDYSNKTERVVIAPKQDCVLMLAVQYGKQPGSNAAYFENVEVRQISK